MSIEEQLARDQRKAKAILISAVQAAGGRLENRTNLYKIFWAAHMVHMTSHGTTLSNWSIVRMPKGPAPDKGIDLLRQLESEGVVRQVQCFHGPYPSYDSELMDESKARGLVKAELTPDEIESIRHTVKEFEGATATQVSNWSHEWSRAWRLQTVNGGELDIYVDLVDDDDEFEALHRRLTDSDETHLVDRLLGRD